MSQTDPAATTADVANPKVMQKRVDDLLHALLTQTGDLDPALRRAMVDRARTLTLEGDPAPDVPEAWVPYLDKVTRYAYKVVDEDIEKLLSGGWSQDAVFEATLCAATGAALARLERGLELLEEDDRAP